MLYVNFVSENDWQVVIETTLPDGPFKQTIAWHTNEDQASDACEEMRKFGEANILEYMKFYYTIPGSGHEGMFQVYEHSQINRLFQFDMAAVIR